MRKILIFIIFFLSFSSVKAFNIDSLQVSLLTVMPRPNEIYTVYGHSALRIHYPSEGLDEVYNWGTFDFNDSPLFIYRFIKGETDYFLSTSSYSHFIAHYAYTNSTVQEQVLDLEYEEKETLVKILVNNLQPGNLVYRYNFLFDNCTTRIRDIIEKSTGDSLVYPQQKNKVTFRELIHSCTEPYPWMTFGIDLLIGSGADSTVSLREEMFLPVKLMDALDESYIIREENGETIEKPIVSFTHQIIKSKPRENSSLFLVSSPLYTGWLVFFIFLGLAAWGIYKRRRLRGVFSILFFIAGIAGSIIGFLILFSIHPCVSPNWNIVWLHPFHFIAFAGYFFKKSYRFISLYHGVNLLLLCLLLISWHWLPQTLNAANIPYILCLATASACWLFNTKRKNNE